MQKGKAPLLQVYLPMRKDIEPRLLQKKRMLKVNSLPLQVGPLMQKVIKLPHLAIILIQKVIILKPLMNMLTQKVVAQLLPGLIHMQRAMLQYQIINRSMYLVNIMLKTQVPKFLQNVVIMLKSLEMVRLLMLDPMPARLTGMVMNGLQVI
jgi:hypothetical protein